MGNCATANCYKNSERSNLEPLQGNQLSASTIHRSEQLVQTKDRLAASFLNYADDKSMNMLIFENGCTYEGEWDPVLKRHGFGIYTWSDGSKYKGQWVNNTANGFGKLEQANGEAYTGYWLNDRAHGYGEFCSKEGMVYKGEWLEDLQHGKGVEIWDNRASYEGEYKMGKKFGLGILRFADGAFYEVTLLGRVQG